MKDISNNRKDRVHKSYNLHLVNCFTETTEQGMPLLDPCDFIPHHLKAFDTCSRLTDTQAGVHFFLDDHRFTWAWSEPLKYVEMLKRFGCVLTPDFSVYVDMLEPMQRYNVFRGRAIGRIWQDAGLNVIPTLTWGFEDSYSFCFDGIPLQATVAISTVGLMKNEDNRIFFKNGVEAGIRATQPQTILAFGNPYEFDAMGATVYWYESDNYKRLAALRDTKTTADNTLSPKG